MLDGDNVEEQTAAAQAIWTLSFDESVRQCMLKDEACLNALKIASQHDREQVYTAAKGALWIIQRTSTNKSKTIFCALCNGSVLKGLFQLSLNMKHAPIPWKLYSISPSPGIDIACSFAKRSSKSRHQSEIACTKVKLRAPN